MAIKQFEEPDINLFFDDLKQAIILNNKSTFVGRGMINIMLSEMDTAGTPLILPGSAWEQNGVFYFADNLTQIEGTLSEPDRYYIYSSGADKRIFFSNNPPKWDALKGAWYYGNDRALAKLFYTGGFYNNKVILDRYGAIYEDNLSEILPPFADGMLIDCFDTNTLADEKEVALDRGFYAVRLIGGTGGNGGNGSTNQNTLKGGAGAKGETIESVFFVETKSKAVLWGGYDGNNGKNSTTNGDKPRYSGGGGGATGAIALLFIPSLAIELKALGGSGGGGSAGDSNGGFGSGGGGAGGFGTGGNGYSPGGYSAPRGGKDSVGGQGGDGNRGTYSGRGGGGGSGFIGYGRYGNNGVNGTSGTSTSGGNGGDAESYAGFSAGLILKKILQVKNFLFAVAPVVVEFILGL